MFAFVPPLNDIYIVTDDRSEACVDKFLSKYADLANASVRTDFEVRDGSSYVETGTLTNTIAYGLADKRRSFVVYFDSAVSGLKSVIVCFTPDGKLVLGLSIEYDENSDAEAAHVLAMLQAEFNVDLGVVSLETHPGDAYDWINENLRQA